MISLPMAAIMIGSLLFSLVGFYVAWRAYRVYLLRLELLTIRNRLWDAALRTNCFENEAYLRCRHNLNLLIRYAHVLDLVTIALAPKAERPEASCWEADTIPDCIKEDVDLAFREAGACLYRYVKWYRPFTGVFLFWFLTAAKVAKKLLLRTVLKRNVTTRAQAARIHHFGTSIQTNTTKWIREDGPASVFPGRLGGDDDIQEYVRLDSVLGQACASV